MPLKEGHRPAPFYMQEGFRRFVSMRREQQVQNVMTAVRTWSTSHPGEKPTIEAIGKSLGIAPKTVNRCLNTIVDTNTDFRDPRNETRPLSAKRANIGNVTKGFAYDHPESFSSLGTVIRRSGVKISSGRARVELEQAGFRVRVIRGEDSTRYIVSVRDEGVINSHLQHRLRKDPQKQKEYTLEGLTRGIVEHHPEIYSTLGSALTKAGLVISPRKIGAIAERLSRLGFRIGQYTLEQQRGKVTYRLNRYCVLTKDLPELVDYLKHAKWALSGFTSASQKPSTSPNNSV